MKNRLEKIKCIHDGGMDIHYFDQYNFSTGLNQSYWKNGKFRKIGMFLNDKFHGVWKYYDDDEQIYSIDGYKVGLENGIMIELT